MNENTCVLHLLCHIMSDVYTRQVVCMSGNQTQKSYCVKYFVAHCIHSEEIKHSTSTKPTNDTWTGRLKYFQGRRWDFSLTWWFQFMSYLGKKCHLTASKPFPEPSSDITCTCLNCTAETDVWMNQVNCLSCWNANELYVPMPCGNLGSYLSWRNILGQVCKNDKYSEYIQ